MAEGGILDALTEGEGGEETEAEGLPPLDPAVAALAMRAVAHDDPLARAAEQYFRSQTNFIGIQTEHLHQQRRLMLSHLRLRQFGERVRVVTQMFIMLIAALFAIGLVLMLIDAFRSRAVVVAPFSVPAGLAAQGLTGEVMAGALLDQLIRLQVATHHAPTAGDLTSAWAQDIRIELPETGISLGEVNRLLRARFGRDVTIEGDAVQTASGGIALTVRGDGVLARSFAGDPATLEQMASQAAEYVFGQAQPTRYAAFLSLSGRNAEVISFTRANYAHAAPADRPLLLNTWATALQNSGGSLAESLALYRAAIRLKPDFWPGYANVMNTTWLLGEEEASWQAGEAMRRAAGGRPGRAPENDYANLDALTWNLPAWRAETLADAAAHANLGTTNGAFAPTLADIDVRQHDLDDAALQLQTAPDGGGDPTIPAMDHFIRGRLATEAGDTGTAAAQMEAFGASFANPAVSSNYPGYACWIAPAEDAAGNLRKADAVLSAGSHYLDCARFRGDILDRRGDWAGAQAAYAAAVALAPDLPAGYFSWGAALARHGATEAAIVRLAAAHARGPHWADPLKLWGDLLARQGKRREALAHYDEALQYAPEWGALRDARARLAKAD